MDSQGGVKTRFLVALIFKEYFQDELKVPMATYFLLLNKKKSRICQCNINIGNGPHGPLDDNTFHSSGGLFLVASSIFPNISIRVFQQVT